MINLTPKPPADKRFYSVDMSAQLAGGTDRVESFTIVRTAGTVTISGETFDTNIVGFLISGGANSETAEFDLTVNTSLGQQFSQDLSLVILDASYSPVGTVTKDYLLKMAYEELTLGGYEFDFSDEQIDSALRRLDTLLRSWAISGLDIGYNASTPISGGTKTDIVGIPDFASEAVYLALAKSLATTIGKSLSAETKSRYAEAMSALRTYCATRNVPQQRLPAGTPLGAGNRPRRGRRSPFSGRTSTFPTGG